MLAAAGALLLGRSGAPQVAWAALPAVLRLSYSAINPWVQRGEQQRAGLASTSARAHGHSSSDDEGGPRET
jgi:hypothetical protein